MKLLTLLEDPSNVEAVLALPTKYPLVGFMRVRTGFVYDLPLNITKEQLRQLFELSFSDAEQKKLMKWTDGQLFIYTPERALEEVKKTIANNKGTVDPEDMSYTWKEWVKFVKQDIQSDGDFAQ